MLFGRYVAISTEHVRYTTAELLNGWATLPAPERPVGVISTYYGWFLPTQDADPVKLPASAAELPAILAFGRMHGCTYVLLDPDAPSTDQLPTFPW